MKMCDMIYFSLLLWNYVPVECLCETWDLGLKFTIFETFKSSRLFSVLLLDNVQNVPFSRYFAYEMSKKKNTFSNHEPKCFEKLCAFGLLHV